MAKTVPNMPQALNDLQWLISWQSSPRTDVITAVIDGNPVRISPFDKTSTATHFMKPDTQSNGLLIDLGRVPLEISEIAFTLDVIAEGERSWTIEGLSTGEVWQNDSVTVPADAPCLLLSLERSPAEGWTVTAKETILGEQGDITVDEQIPEAYQDLVAKATARSLAGNAINFIAVIDVTASMKEAHDRGDIAKILDCVAAISASANNRPIQVTYHGITETRISVDEDIPASYSESYGSALAQMQLARPLHIIVPELLLPAKRDTKIFVLTDSMFFIDEDLLDELESKSIFIEVLLTGSESPKFNLADGKYLKITTVGDLSSIETKFVMDRLS